MKSEYCEHAVAQDRFAQHWKGAHTNEVSAAQGLEGKEKILAMMPWCCCPSLKVSSKASGYLSHPSETEN